MRADKVITFHRVRVRDDFEDTHVAYPYRGMEGTIQEPARLYGAMGNAVGVKFDDHHPTTTWYFKPEWLDDITDPLPDVGDIILVRAMVIERNGEQIEVQVNPDHMLSNWIDRSDHKGIVERAPKVPNLPEEPTDPGVLVRTSLWGGRAWIRDDHHIMRKAKWFDFKTSHYVEWADVVREARELSSSLVVFNKADELLSLDVE